MNFTDLGLNPAILKALEQAGYTSPTPIQERAIPAVLAGKDLLASAQTGTGKTAAFMLPALELLSRPDYKHTGYGPRMLVLTPTRELALQVTTAASKYGRQLRSLKVGSILGGMPYPLQNRLLNSPLDVLVATPGRLIDHIERGRVDFSRLELLVLDEADRMLDMGFIDAVESIVAAIPGPRQTLLFSATLEGRIGKLAAQWLRDPERIEITSQKARHDNITQRMHLVDDQSHKDRVLDHLIRDADLRQGIIFTATKREADDLAGALREAGHRAAALHGDMRQHERNRTLTRMRQGEVRLLVATDVAARGIDVPGISHVINYDLPKSPEDYVHRIGRTGRGNATGIAVSFATYRDSRQVQLIERFTGQTIPHETIPGLEPRFKSRPAANRERPPQRAGERARPWVNSKPQGAGARYNAGAPAPRHDGGMRPPKKQARRDWG